jgi:hypothetical protein
LAEAKGADALLERCAMAAAETLQEHFELEGVCDVLFDLRELAGGEFFPSKADGSIVAKAAEEELDFGEGEAHVGGEADKENTVECVHGVAALAANTLRRGKEAALFVIADGGSVEAGANGKFTNFHDDLPEMLLDLKLALSFSIWGWDVAILIGGSHEEWERTVCDGKQEECGDRDTSSPDRRRWSGGLEAQGGVIVVRAERPMATVQSKFYCNSKALTLEERARHKQLTEKLMAARKETVETEKGYEFQFSPSDVSLAELANWVAAESKCCPFFDFHIDVEHEGRLLCLRLTGEDGIEAFIRAEFALQ